MIYVCCIFSVKTKDIDITISNILEGKIVIPPNASDNSILVVPSNKLQVQVSAEIRDKVNTQISVSIKGQIILGGCRDRMVVGFTSTCAISAYLH